MRMFLLCLANTFLMALGQILFKYAVNGREFNSITQILKMLLNPVVLVALTIYGCSTLLWLYILSKVPMSFAYPIQQLALPLVFILSMLIFKETIIFTRWIGIAIVFVGVFVATRF